MQVFLSHSSKQKGYVKIVAEKLGKFYVVFDEWTFEAGNKTLTEIYDGIDASGIFVYFISEDSLKSTWVQKEIHQAEKYIKDGKLKRFLPIIIDHNIKHDDLRIPKWIKDEYNLRYIAKPTKTYDLIKQAMRLVLWDLYPKKKEADQLFIGRTPQIKLYEERIFDVDRKIPISIIISGFPSIGRRKFIRHVLINSNKIKPYYIAPVITLDGRNSIEDLIIMLYGLGYSQIEKNLILNLTSKTQTEKINIAVKLISELFNNNDIVYIVDNLSIVSRDGNIVDWFIPIINNLKDLKGIVLCLISQARINPKLLRHNDYIFSIDIPELESYERKAFFKALLDIENIELNSDDFKKISDQFKGFPEQVIYTMSLLLSEGLPHVRNNLHEIIDYNAEKVAKIIKNYDSNPLAIQILKILSESEFFSLSTLENILKEDFEPAKKILTQLSQEFIIEYIGNMREFLRLNDSVKDYVQRLGYKLEEKYKKNIQVHAKEAFKDYDILDRDISDYVISFKEALKDGSDIPNEFLIPSHYVNAMRELYNYERRFKDVINLADRVLQNEAYLDRKIVKEIRYWLCLSLARKRDKRILEEAHKIDNPDQNFLLGFYYRIVGRHDDAIKRLKDVLKDAPGFYRAKRELVQVYLNTEQYSEAFTLAQENYYLDKNNPYNLQSYFRCLLRVDDKSINKNDELKSLLDELYKSLHVKAKEMYMTLIPQYTSYIEKNDSQAVILATDAISAYPKSIYPYLTKLDLLRKNLDFVDMDKTVSEIETKFDSDADILQKLPYLACKALLLTSKGDTIQASRILTEVKNRFSNSVYDHLSQEIQWLISSKHH